ncbi:MAG TPA: hypothetical protein VEH27_04275 [Methylomirabilota bacterium]|nr:hypothetical protein [Methylomirabilota bacterium]
MKFWLAVFVWVMTGVVLGYGIYRLVVNSSPALFIISLLVIIGSIGYFCATDPSSNHSEHPHH